MKSFAIIGLAGFVAKKHVKCIKNINGKLLAALDKHDNVGFIDKDFSSCVFFKNEKKFFEHIKKKKNRLCGNLLTKSSTLYTYYKIFKF